MSAILAAMLAKALPWLAGLAALIAGAAGVFFAGKRTAKSEARADRAEASLETRKRIDEATANAPTDPDAARAALRERLSRK